MFLHTNTISNKTYIISKTIKWNIFMTFISFEKVVTKLQTDEDGDRQ